jgi:hypothetical protein
LPSSHFTGSVGASFTGMKNSRFTRIPSQVVEHEWSGCIDHTEGADPVVKEIKQNRGAQELPCWI